MGSIESHDDLAAKPLPFLLLWGLPIAGMLALNFVQLPLVWMTGWLAAGFTWMGVGCAINARRCHRRHCYFASPVLLVGAALTLLVGLGVIQVGPAGLAYITWGTFAGVMLTFVPERLFGKYRAMTGKD